MIEFAKVLGRLLAIMVSKGLIDKDDALYIAEPLKEAENGK